MPEKQPQPVDVLFVIALDEEKEAMLSEFPTPPSVTKYDENKLGLFSLRLSSDRELICAVWLVGDMGPEAVLLELADVVRVASPKLVINVGIAGMLSGDARIGDSVIVEGVLYYSHRGAISTGTSIQSTLVTGGKFINTTSQFLDRFKVEFKNRSDLKADYSEASARFAKSNDFADAAEKIQSLTKQHLIGVQQQVAFGEVASGPFVGRSSDFKNFLLNKNRNLLALEMESGAVAMVMSKKFRSVPCVMVKGISDPSDEFKKAVESITHNNNRVWAARNAMRLALMMIRHVEIPPRVETSYGAEGVPSLSIEQLTGKYSMPRSYRVLLQQRDTVSIETLHSLAKAFSLHPCRDGESPLSTIEAALFEIPTKSAIALTGAAGTGKTSLLCLLYVYLWKRHALDSALSEPLLISLSPSLGFFDEDYFEETLETKLIHIEEYFASVEARDSDESVNYVLLLDSADADQEAELRLRAVVTRFCEKRPHTIVVGGRNEKMKFGVPTSKRFHLAAHNRRTCDLNALTAGFLHLASRYNDDTQRALLKFATDSPHDQIDFFDLGVALQLFDSASLGAKDREPTIAYLEFARLRLKQLSVPEDKIDTEILAAAHAVVYLRGDALPDEVRSGLSKEGRALLNAHPRLRDFLLAHAVVYDLAAYSGGETPESLLRVYPSRVSTFCKDLLRRQGVEEKCCSNAIELIKCSKSTYLTKALAVYILGRLKDRQQCGKARQFLKTKLEEARLAQEMYVVGEAEEREALLYARTVYITLAYLGDRGALEEYIGQLVTRPLLDRINRGFHLEYYGDLDYDYEEALQNDDFLEECPQTCDRLASRLSRASRSPLFELEVQTYFSLAIHRHLHGRLDLKFREQATGILESKQFTHSITNEQLRGYLKMVHTAFADADCRPGRVLAKFHRIKETQRSGWSKRGLKDCETVAAHTYGAYLLGLFLLPSKTEDGDYSKQEILDMLLVHDLAEAITGDIAHENKGERHTQIELAELKKLQFYGYISGNEELTQVCTRVEDFEHHKGINAAVARDIDKLEILMQLYAFRKSGASLENDQEWEEEIKEQITTRIGRNMLEMIQGGDS